MESIRYACGSEAQDLETHQQFLEASAEFWQTVRQELADAGFAKPGPCWTPDDTPREAKPRRKPSPRLTHCPHCHHALPQKGARS